MQIINFNFVWLKHELTKKGISSTVPALVGVLQGTTTLSETDFFSWHLFFSYLYCHWYVG